MTKYKYIALIRETTPDDDTDGPAPKFVCEVVGWSNVSGYGGNTVEEAIESARDMVRHMASEGKYHQPNIRAIEFEVDV